MLKKGQVHENRKEVVTFGNYETTSKPGKTDF